MPFRVFPFEVIVEQFEDFLGFGQLLRSVTGSLLGFFGVLDIALLGQPLRQLLRDRTSGLHRFFAAHHFPRHEIAEEFAVTGRNILWTVGVAKRAARFCDRVVLAVMPRVCLSDGRDDLERGNDRHMAQGPVRRGNAPGTLDAGLQALLAQDASDFDDFVEGLIRSIEAAGIGVVRNARVPRDFRIEPGNISLNLVMLYADRHAPGFLDDRLARIRRWQAERR